MWTIRLGRQLDEIEADLRLQGLLLAGTVIVATTLRFFRLGRWSFWGDEIITVHRALGIFQDSVSRWSTSLILTNLALNTAGVSEWSARLAPALAGIATVAVFFFLVRSVFNAGTALIASFLLAISPWHIYWSQNARFYAFLLLFFTAALFYFYLGLERDRLVFFLVSLGFLGLAVLEQLTALLFLPVVGAYLLLLLTGKFEQPAGFKFKNLAVFLLPGLVPGVYMVLNFPAIRQPSLWARLFGWVNTNPFWITSGVVYYVGVPAICAAFVGAAYLIHKRQRSGLLFGLGAILPLILIAGVSLFQYAANRYVFVSLTSWLLLAGVAGHALLKELSSGGARILGVGLILVLTLAPLSEDALYFLYQNGNRDDWKSAFSFVDRMKSPGDLVVSANPALGSYYLKEEVVGMGRIDRDGLLQEGARVWIVEDMTVAAKHPEFRSWFRRHGRLVEEFDVRVRARNFEMNVYLLELAGVDDHSGLRW